MSPNPVTEGDHALSQAHDIQLTRTSSDGLLDSSTSPPPHSPTYHSLNTLPYPLNGVSQVEIVSTLQMRKSGLREKLGTYTRSQYSLT